MHEARKTQRTKRAHDVKRATVKREVREQTLATMAANRAKRADDAAQTLALLDQIVVMSSCARVAQLEAGICAYGQDRNKKGRLGFALHKLMLQHDCPWPRVEQLDGSSLTVKAHYGKLNMGAKAAFLKMELSDLNGHRIRSTCGPTAPTRSYCPQWHSSSCCAGCCVRFRCCAVPISRGWARHSSAVQVGW